MEISKIERLNDLAKKAKTDTLTSSELVEREQLRKEYIGAFRSNLKATLDNTVIVDKDGNRRSLRKDN
jgi:uncharacterized protein YnzC (UPF0291/DUF896 family)